jgi:transposase
MERYIGLDVHCKESVYVVQDEQGHVVKEGVVETTEAGLKAMGEDLGVPPGTKVGLETGTQATWVARVLERLGMKPVVIDAHEVRAKARRVGQKSDRRDAWEICDGVRRDLYTAIVYVPSEAVERLRRVLSRRRHFIKARTRQVNAAKFVLRSRGLRSVCRTLTTARAWQRLLADARVQAVRDHLALHHRVWQVVEENVVELDKELACAAEPFDELTRRLQTLAGIGPVTAASYVAAVGTPERFPDSSHVVSYLGLAVSTYDSGQRERHGHITKRGAADVRGLLCEAAQHASNPTHALNPYFLRLYTRHGRNVAVIAVAQRMARILFQMWRTGQDFDVRKLNVRPVQRVRSRTYYFEIKSPKAVRV